jgi:hypothetical protein
MDALLGGLLLALTCMAAWLCWNLLVRPRALLGLWSDGGASDGWFEDHPVGLRALQLATGATVLLLGFLTGLVWSFLITTA